MKRWSPPKRDVLEHDGKPKCQECRATPTHAMRYISFDVNQARQLGRDVETKYAQSEVKHYGHWVAVWSCNEHVLLLREKWNCFDVTPLNRTARNSKKPAVDQQSWEM